MKEGKPVLFQKIQNDYPDVYEAYQKLGNACHKSGPLGDETRRLIKLSLSLAIGSEGAVHSNVRRALAEGISKEKLKHVVLLAIPTIGFPKSMAAMSWIDDLLD